MKRSTFTGELAQLQKHPKYFKQQSKAINWDVYSWSKNRFHCLFEGDSKEIVKICGKWQKLKTTKEKRPLGVPFTINCSKKAFNE